MYILYTLSVDFKVYTCMRVMSSKTNKKSKQGLSLSLALSLSAWNERQLDLGHVFLSGSVIEE